jgi:hypothetical protein
MNKKKAISFLIIAAVVAVLAVLAYLLLFGKLFPHSPIVLGFEKHELQRVVVYVEKGAMFNRFQEIDSYIPMVENFHTLTFRKKPRIFLFGSRKTYADRSLSKARFCAFYNGDIVVSPWAQKEASEGLISMEIYLRHELSHSLIYQHAGILNAFRYPDWLLEGIAVYSANQMGTSWYPSKEQTYSYIRNGDFMPPRFYKTKKEDQINIVARPRTPFMYCEFACIVDYLVNRYGKDKFLAYMKELLSGGNHDDVFKTIYGIDFDQCIRDFKKSVMQQP